MSGASILSVFFVGLLTLSEARGETSSWNTFRNGFSNAGVSAISVKDFSERGRSPFEFKVGGLIWGTPVLDEEGNVFFGSSNKKFYSIDSRNQIRWDYTLFDFADSLIDSAAALHPNGLVIVPGGDGYLHALDRKTGNRVWTFKGTYASDSEHQSGKIVNSFEGNVQVGPDGSIYAGSDNGYLYAVNEKDGTELWSVKTGHMIWSTPAIHPQNLWMAFGSLDGKLRLVNPRNGEVFSEWDSKSWKAESWVSQAEIKSSPAMDDEGNLYFGTSFGKIVSLKVLESGPKYTLKQNWEYEAGEEVYSSPAVKDDRVVVGSVNGNIYCFNRHGQLQWIYPTYSPIKSSPLITADNVVIFGAKNGKIYALDLENGSRIWSYRTTTSEIKSNLDSSPILGPNRIIYVGSYSGILFGIPYEFCLQNPQDSRCEREGTFDLPDFARNLKNPANLLPLKSSGVGISETVQLRFVAFKNGKYEPRAVIDATPAGWTNGMTFSIDPPANVELQVSSDGHFLNVLPKSFLLPNTQYRLRVQGKYYFQTQNWFFDRGNFWTYPFDAEAVFTTGDQVGTPEVTQEPNQFKWGIKSFYLTQPEALDTYTPAALDAQAFIISPFRFNPLKKEFLALVLPALPSPQNGFKKVAEPSKVFAVKGRYQDSSVQVEGEAKLAAMGGEIPFERFILNLDQGFAQSGTTNSPVEGTFSATAWALGIKGNGSNYNFPVTMLNQICDPWFKVHGHGSMLGYRLDPREMETFERGKVRLVYPHDDGSIGVHLDVFDKDEPAARTDFKPFLFSVVKYDPNDLKVLGVMSHKVSQEDISPDGSVRITLQAPKQRFPFLNWFRPSGGYANEAFEFFIDDHQIPPYDDAPIGILNRLI